MKLKILFTDGTVGIMDLISGDAAAAIAKWHPSEQARVLSFAEILPSDIPTDRTFRNAWGHDLLVNMVTAREIHRERIRSKRNAAFARWDVEWMKATAVGDTVAAAAAEANRQLLRDAPQYPSIDAATTPAELKAAIPPILV